MLCINFSVRRKRKLFFRMFSLWIIDNRNESVEGENYQKIKQICWSFFRTFFKWEQHHILVWRNRFQWVIRRIWAQLVCDKTLWVSVDFSYEFVFVFQKLSLALSLFSIPLKCRNFSREKSSKLVKAYKSLTRQILLIVSLSFYLLSLQKLTRNEKTVLCAFWITKQKMPRCRRSA